MSEGFWIVAILFSLVTVALCVWRVCLCKERVARYESNTYEAELDDDATDDE